jgi:hypothetical protein
MDEAKVRTASLIPLHSQKWQGGEEQRVEEQRKATADDADRLSCRMFPNMYPEVDDVVMVNVTKVADVGAYVTLLEYNDIEVCKGSRKHTCIPLRKPAFNVV